jgi:hypothetical protein
VLVLHLAAGYEWAAKDVTGPKKVMPNANIARTCMKLHSVQCAEFPYSLH